MLQQSRNRIEFAMYNGYGFIEATIVLASIMFTFVNNDENKRKQVARNNTIFCLTLRLTITTMTHREVQNIRDRKGICKHLFQSCKDFCFLLCPYVAHRDRIYDPTNNLLGILILESI